MQPSPPYDRSVSVAIRSHRRLYRDTLVTCLATRSELTVVGHVSDDASLLDLCVLRTPDLVLFDTGADVESSLGTLRELRSRFARTRVVLVYDELSPAEFAAASQIGVETLVPCSHGFEALVVVLHRYAQTLRPRSGEARRRSRLTDQEREIITLVAAGHPVSRIAELLGISARAVENRRRRIYAKLHAVSKGHAIARAAALGLINRPHPPQPSYAKPRDVRLVVLRGPAGPARDRVVVTLLAHQVAFVAGDRGQPDDPDVWDRVHPGPVFLLLVDPDPRDWEGVDRLRVPVLLACSTHVPRDAVLRALGSGVVAVLPTERIEELLVPALVMAMSGCLVAGPQPAAELLTLVRNSPAGRRVGLPELTLREGDILGSIARGDTVRQTARSLGIAEKTVENTQARLFRKLGAHNRAGALAAAHELGLLDLPTHPPDPAW